MEKLLNKSTIVIACIFICMSAIFADLKIKSGKIINQNGGGNIDFDLSNDGNANLTMTSNGSVGVGVINPVSTFDMAGSFGLNSEIYTASGCISGNSIVLANTSSSNITLTLPLASTVTGRVYQIKKISDSYELTINASANIDKNDNLTLSTTSNGFPYVNVYSSGTQWYISSKSGN